MRIISLMPSHTEILFYLGLGDLVMGVTRHCDYPDILPCHFFCRPGPRLFDGMEWLASLVSRKFLVEKEGDPARGKEV